jgi:hypothetical protein
VTAKGASASGGSEGGQARTSAIARHRNAGEDFSASFHELQDEVRGACRRQSRWEAKIVAGVRATLDFAAANPAKATALTLDARRPSFGESNPEQVVIAHFVALLGKVAPAERRFPVATDQSIVESVAALIRGHLLRGSEDQLPNSVPDIVYLALMPYLELPEVARWTETILPDRAD